MSKREKAVQRAAEKYADEIERRFPGARTSAVLESFEGFDAWIEIELPPELHERRPDVMDLTVELNERFDGAGIHLTATVSYVEEVGAHG